MASSGKCPFSICSNPRNIVPDALASATRPSSIFTLIFKSPSTRLNGDMEIILLIIAPLLFHGICYVRKQHLSLSVQGLPSLQARPCRYTTPLAHLSAGFLVCLQL